MIQRITLARPRVIIILCALAISIGAGGLALSTVMPDARVGGGNSSTKMTTSNTNADVIFSSPKTYAVIVDRKKNITRLYSKGSLIFQENSWTPLLTIERIEAHGVLVRQNKTDRKKLLPYGHELPGLPHLTLVKGIALTEIRHEFKVVDQQPDPEPTLKRIEGTRAYLVKEVLGESLLPTRQPRSQTSLLAAPQAPSLGDLISRIQVTQLGEDNFAVDRDSLRPLAKAVRQGLASPKKSFGLGISLLTPTRLELTSSVGDATLSDQGFTITRFGFNRTDELGLQVGDRILSINDQSVTSPLSAWGVVRTLLTKNQELSQLQVKLVRDDLPIIKTYRLK